MDGVLTDDERRVVSAAYQLGLILSSHWPDLAAHLLAQGADGESVAELAGLSRTASPWVVDQLVPNLLSELAIPELSSSEAGDLVARLLGQVAATTPAADKYAVIRKLARMSADLDYPSGVIGDAYSASEWLDCKCHANSPERDAAVVLENVLRASEPLNINAGLLLAVGAAWV